jgi:hypothetical protein
MKNIDKWTHLHYNNRMNNDSAFPYVESYTWLHFVLCSHPPLYAIRNWGVTPIPLRVREQKREPEHPSPSSFGVISEVYSFERI